MILGPPGCGKTTRLKEVAASVLAAGVDPTRIGFWTFTRSARNELFERLGGSQHTFPWLRTIHSTAFRLLGLTPGQMLVDERWQEFGKRYGYELSKSDPNVDDVEDLPRQTPDDLLRFVCGWGRNRRLDPRAALGKARVRGVGVQRYEQFVRRLERFKAEESLLDFADLLEAVLERRLCPPVEVAFLDEAQDLSPLQIAVVELWFGACKRVYVAGDDDQAVYGFQGAEPTWLGELAQRGSLETLEQSHRVPVVAHQLAERIIRQNKARVTKAYRPADRIGRMLKLDLERAVAQIDGTRETLVLARNRYCLAAYAKALVQRLVPFRAEGPGIHSPLTNDRLVRAVNCAGRLAQLSTAAVAAQDLDALLSYVPVDGVLVKRGVKACVKQAVEAEGVFTRE
ncbi:MAG: ATP-dependent helicase, partial [Planctomycetes bacterium]|nr:ATP-dependent helicase [Planctomycetota bacterium]